uniref:Immunoglobulin V-set domain-containing protein n=1 Tax=Sinocyclocheilus anshuiensis TaxID=1608454 RepID=A0A671N8Z6_9TELE
SGPQFVKKPGETLTLSCIGSGSSFGCCSMHWTRQQAGKPLVRLGRVHSHGNSHDFSDSFSRRIEITRDNSKGMVYLKLGLTAEDSAFVRLNKNHTGCFISCY